MKEPVDHIVRAILPWREAEKGLTECGLAAASFPTIARETYFARRREMGAQRAALFTCMTCAGVVCHYAPWDDDPVSAISREAPNYWSGYDHDGYTRRSPDPKHEGFRRELRAIAALIESHRQEFDAHVAGLGAVSELDEARRKKKVEGKSPRANRWSKL